MSGTIPPFSVTALKAFFDLVGNAIEIRESGNQPELEHLMKTSVQSDMLESMVIQIIESERQTWTPKDRGLVFVTHQI